MNVKLIAAFGGFKPVPWLAWGHNNMAPRLVLHPDKIEYRLFRTRLRPYAEVELVDYRSTWRTFNVVLSFEGALTTFNGNTGEERTAREAIAYLADRGCLLSERANRLLKSTPA